MNKLFLYLLLAGLTACTSRKEEPPPHHHGQIQAASAHTTEDHITLNATQIRLANITTQQVKSGPIGQTVVLNARVKADETRSAVISSRISGRVEKLFFKESGRTIRKGEPLYQLYSEVLLTLQREYLLAQEQYERMDKSKRYLDYLKAAENKLLRYGLSKKQIDQLANSKEVQQHITLLSPASGLITAINASEGQYVNEGSLLYRIEDLNELWIEAELYPSEIKLVKAGDEVVVHLNQDQQDHAAVVLTILPEYKAGSQTAILRARLKNNDHAWKPGMQAQVFLTHSSRQAITIPLDGVIRSQQGAQVFILSDTNTFQSRSVKTGIENYTTIEITEGLKEGETVVTSGAYLLYSEFILK